MKKNPLKIILTVLLILAVSVWGYVVYLLNETNQSQKQSKDIKEVAESRELKQTDQQVDHPLPDPVTKQDEIVQQKEFVSIIEEDSIATDYAVEDPENNGHSETIMKEDEKLRNIALEVDAIQIKHGEGKTITFGQIALDKDLIYWSDKFSRYESYYLGYISTLEFQGDFLFIQLWA